MTPATTDTEYLETLVDQKSVDEGITSVVEAIHGKRVMPPGTPLPGIVDVYRTPYLLELMENMSPRSPVYRTTVMKSVQSAMTWFAECCIAACQLHWPTKMLYLTATDKALKKWVKRLEPLITSMGLRQRIVSDNPDSKTRSTGDKALSKTFQGGGALEMGSLQSPSDLASDSVQIAIADEIDRAPEQLRSGEGNFLRVLEGRLEAFLWKAKMLVFSTPTTWEESLVYQEFKLGDQREYYVPCKHCGHMFYMEFKHLVPVYDDKKMLDYAWLKCPECEGRHINADKTWMLARDNGAEWRPTAIPTSRNHRSYHISKMMVPVGLATWTNIYQKYIEAKAADDMAPFYNLQLGLPFKEQGSRPKIVVDEMKGAYGEREIPDGVLFIAVGMDVQQGSATDLSRPPRLEMEVVGIGKNFRTWGLEYKVFTDPEWPKGPGISDVSAGAWQSFIQWALLDEKFKYVRSDGRAFYPSMMFIDSGDGVTMDTVYQFTERPDIVPGWIFPSKGVGFFKKNKEIYGDETSQHNMMKYKPSKNARSGDVVFYDVATNHYKKMVYRNLKLKREFDPGKDQRMGFCDFAQGMGYDARYFKMLTNAEMRADGSFHKIGDDEALDCRVYALCAGDVYLDAQVAHEREMIRMTITKNGGRVDPLALQQINRLWVLDKLEKATRRQK